MQGDVTLATPCRDKLSPTVCQQLADSNYCVVSQQYMAENCPLTCHICQGPDSGSTDVATGPEYVIVEITKSTYMMKNVSFQANVYHNYYYSANK